MVLIVRNTKPDLTLVRCFCRIGRTARAGAGGQSVTFIEDGDRALVKEVVRRTKAQMQQRVVPPQVGSGRL